MYEEHFGLQAKPFQLSPDAAFFFPSKEHKRALSFLEYGLSQADGFIVITGDVGTGKTTILQTLLNIFEFDEDWYPNLHLAIEWPRVQTLHFYASFWPHQTGFNRINIESNVDRAIIDELRNRGHEVRVVPPFRISGCSTAVMLDPKTGSRIAAADPRRDCYAAAY